jgi:hypothetical protein
MAEDSGAFKTNQRNSAQIGHFVIARETAARMPHHRKNTDLSLDRGRQPHIL